MPCRPRLDLANLPPRVVQRGHDREPRLCTDVDRMRHLQDLREIALHGGCHVHAYVVMANHAQLVMTPTAGGQIARVMPSPDRRCMRDINDRYIPRARCGTDAARHHWHTGKPTRCTAIEMQLSRRAGPAKIERPQPEKSTTKSASDRCFDAVH